MKRLQSEPLVHFLLAGVFLLGVATLFRGGDREPGGKSPNTIRVDPASLEQFVRAKTGIEDDDEFATRFASLDEAARRDWVDRFVREEALVREARRLGLDQQDDLIRRRLVQQIEFVALGVVESDLEFGPEELNAAYLARREDYRVPATLSFSHVYVQSKSAPEFGQDGVSRGRAELLLSQLNAESVDADGAIRRGDRFLYNRNYVDRTLDEIESHFGESMASTLGALDVDATKWQGPFRSAHGYHLVLLTDSRPSRLPEIDEVREVLHEDWRRAMRDAALDRAVDEIIEGYVIELVEPGRE